MPPATTAVSIVFNTVKSRSQPRAIPEQNTHPKNTRPERVSCSDPLIPWPPISAMLSVGLAGLVPRQPRTHECPER